MKTIYRMLPVVSLIAVTALCRCMLPISGGGTEDGNATKLCGKVTYATGKGASGAQVCLLDRAYNPALQQPVPEYYTTVTDTSGSYTFTLGAHDTATFNIETHHLESGMKAFVRGIQGKAESTVFASQCVLSPTGTVKLFISDTLDTAGAYLVVPGTSVFKAFSEAQKTPQGDYVLYLDGLPAVMLPSIVYYNANTPSLLIAILDSVKVFPGDTTITHDSVYTLHFTEDKFDLPSNLVIDIFSDRSGNKWFATVDGIARLKKKTWTKFTTPELPDGMFTCIAEDSGGVLWFGTKSQGAVTFDGSRWTEYPIHQNPDADLSEINCIACDQKGTVWFGTDHGVIKYDGSTWIQYDSSNSQLHSGIIWDLCIDAKATPWCAVGHSIAIFNGLTWTPWIVGGMPKPSLWMRILIDRSGRVWLGNTDGDVVVYDSGTWDEYGFESSWVLSGPVTALKEDADGVLWVATEEGLTKFDGKSWQDYTGDKYPILMNRSVFDIEIDTDRSLWAATDSGVIVIGPSRTME